MNTNKALIVGLLATVGGGLLQADSLTFAINDASGIHFGGGIGNAFSVTSGSPLHIGTVLNQGTSSSTCTSCTFTFSTVLNAFTDQTGGGGSAFFYGFNANSTSTAFNAVGGTLPNPGTPPPTSFTGTLANGTIGASLPGGFQPTGGPATLTFNIPVTAIVSTNLTNIFAAFGLTQAAGDGGLLSFQIITTAGNAPTGGNFGAFTGNLSQASLTLDAVPKIPEPASAMLIGLGLICVAFVGRKRMLAHRL
jgi:hypothetical protein